MIRLALTMVVVSSLLIAAGPVAAQTAKPAKAPKAKPAATAQSATPAAEPATPAAEPAVAPKSSIIIPPITDEEIDNAVKKGCEYLIKLQQPDGNWPGYQTKTYANTIMVMLALAYADYDMKSDVMKKGIKALIAIDADKLPGEKTYQVAFRMQALAKLVRLVDRETRELVLDRLKKDAEYLVSHQSKVGGWSYDPSPASTELGDFSNVQISVLGLGEAVKVGIELPQEPFIKVQTLYIDKQLADGGWSYGNQQKTGWPWALDQSMPSYGSMTAAGVASLFITRDYLYRGLGCPCKAGVSNYKANKVDQAIERGLKWLGKYYDPNSNPRGNNFEVYWHYSCERVGLASGIKYFGGHNWYQEGGRFILSGQQSDGSWGHYYRPPMANPPADYPYPAGSWTSAPGAAWCLLFLIKGRAPVLMNKLQFEGAWNYHPQDLANLARYVGDTKEQPFAWQVINLEAPVDEWHDAPILYMTPETVIKLSPDDKKHLRKFTDDGGTIFFEASCGAPIVRAWWMAMTKEIWPEFEFRLVDKDHPVWTADTPMTKKLPGVQEMSDGVRSFMFYTPNDISCAWNTTQLAGRGEAFQFGLNLYTYSTDKAKIRSRLVGSSNKKAADAEVKTLTPGGRGTLTLARLRHGGDWNVTDHYGTIQKLADRFAANEHLKLEVHPPVSASDATLPADAVLFTTGRQGITLSDAEQAALRKRLDSGGFLVVDATVGDSRFDQSFRDLATAMKWTLKQLPPDSPIASGTMPRGSGHKLENIKFTQAAIVKATAPLRLDLIGIYAGDKMVGVYSWRDLMYSQAGLRAFGSIGYDNASAQRIIDNIIIYATSIDSPARAGPGRPAAGPRRPDVSPAP